MFNLGAVSEESHNRRVAKMGKLKVWINTCSPAINMSSCSAPTYPAATLIVDKLFEFPYRGIYILI